MSESQWMGDEAYLKLFGQAAQNDDHMKFAAKMKSKAWDREVEDRRRLAAMSEEERNALMMQVMLEEAELSRGLTKEQNQHRIKMEKIGWEQEDRARLGMCRWYDCEKPAGTSLMACACHMGDIVYCSPECQTADWKLQHKNVCEKRKKK